MIYIWLIIVILLAIAEFMTVNLVTIWYVASGLITIALSFFIDNFYIQLGIFTILGTVLLITTRTTLMKVLKIKSVRTNADKIIDQEAVVLEKIDKNIIGKVKIDGNEWRAVSDHLIKKGKVVIIKEIKGNKVIVEEMK